MLTALIILTALPMWFFAGLFLSGFLSDHMGAGEKTSRIVGWAAPLLLFFSWVASGR